MKLVPERDPLPRHLAFVYLGLAALVGTVMAVWGQQVERSAFCYLRRNIGLPCPTCGGTHSTLALVRGDLASAWVANPLVAAAALLLALWATYALVATLHPPWRRQVQFTQGERKLLRISAVLAFLGGWIYQILRLA